MRRTLTPLALSLTLAAAPAWAQETAPADPFDGPSLVERGVERMMRDLLGEMAPAIEEMEGMSRLLGGVVERLEEYQAPEMLPNGDIIIRRKPDAPPIPAPDDLGPGAGEIEL